MADIVFSKLSGKNDSAFKAIEGVQTEILQDAFVEKVNHDQVLDAIFNVKKSKKFAERGGGYTEFGNFMEVGEGDKGVVDGIEEGYGKLIQHLAFSKDFTTTREMIDDGDIDAAKTASASFIEAYKRSKLEFATNFLTSQGTTFTYMGKTYDRTTGDGKGLFDNSHPGKKKGVAAQSNIFKNAFGTDINMLNRLANIGRNYKNDSGNISAATFDTLIIPGNTPELEETANRVINTQLVVGSNNNDINTQKGKWRLIVDHLWEAPNGKAPYILMSSKLNKALRGLMFYNRIDLDIRNEIENSSRNVTWNGYTRFSVGAFNWRQVIMGGADVGTTLT